MKKIAKKLLSKPYLIITPLCIIIAVITIMVNTNLRAEQNEITEQLARQEKIINGLMKKQREAETLVKETVPVVTSEQLKEELGTLNELVTQRYI